MKETIRSSIGILREDTDNSVLLIFLLEVLFVLISEPVEGNEGEKNEERVAELGTHFPRRDLSWVTIKENKG